MVGTTEERHAVAVKLRALVTQADWLKNFIDGEQSSSIASQAEAKERLALLKDELEAEYERMKTVQGTANLNSVEKAFYMPTVHKAFVALRIRRNTNPSMSWSDPLYHTRFELNYTLQQLEPNSSTE